MPKLHWDKMHFLIILKNERGGGEAQRDSYSVIHEESLDNPIEIMAGQTHQLYITKDVKMMWEVKGRGMRKGSTWHINCSKYMVYFKEIVLMKHKLFTEKIHK